MASTTDSDTTETTPTSFDSTPVITTTETIRQSVVAFSASAKGILRTKTYLEQVVFDRIITDHGNFLATHDSNRAVFRSPVSGIYMFHATSVADGNGATPLVLIHNDREILVTGRSDAHSTGPYPIGVGHALVELEAGDELSLFIKPRMNNVLGVIFNKFSSPSDVKFSAFLVQQL